MSEQRRFAVILVRNNTSVAPLTIEQAKRMVLTDEDSILKYWRDNAENWISFSPVDFYGSYDVNLPVPPDSRYTVLNAAKAAAQNNGVDLSPYDAIVVFLHPANPGGTGYDAGATGVGPGSACVLPTTDDRTFYCHETGHVLGFDHTYGILNSGADWSDDGIAEVYPVYGDPYDLMSSASFGGASPTFTLPVSQTIPDFPNGLSAGPMLSRANLHFTKPGALEATNKVRHVYEGGTDEVFTVYPAGQGDAGKPELIVFHPLDEDESGRGRVYVEYRQPFDFNWASRWDTGLAANGADRDNRGLVVHVVKDIPGSSNTAVWYAGRIVFPSPDSDLRVDTSVGFATVTVSDEFVQQKTPAFVRVRVNRSYSPRVSIIENVSETVNVISTEMRPIPGWEWAGLFTWERRQTIRTVDYIPVVAGLGGAGVFDGRDNINVYWYVGGYQPDPPETGVTNVPQLGGGPRVDVNFSIDTDTRMLTLSNIAGSGPLTISVHASASDEATWRDPISADTSFTADGVTEGWGEDYKRFMDMWYRITHPNPKRRFGPPKPDEYKQRIDDLIHVYDKLRALNPEVAGNMQSIVMEQIQSLQQSMTLQKVIVKNHLLV